MADIALNYPHKSMTFNIVDDSDIDVSRDSFIDSKKDCFPFGSSSPFSSNSSSAQIAFIQLKDSCTPGLFLLAEFCQTDTQQLEDTVDCVSIQACKSCNFSSFHIDDEQVDEASKLSF